MASRITLQLRKFSSQDIPAARALNPKLFKHETHFPKVRGMDIMKDPRINKGMAFSLRERQLLGIHGLLPPAFLSQEMQAERVMRNLDQQPNDLAKFVQLNALQDRNETLFYSVLIENVEKLMPIVYTPTVGLACQKYGFIYRRPKGLYITINDNSVDKIYHMLANWEHEARAIVVTDGERILGLGDLGANGMGIPIGKLSLYVALAGMPPEWCLPITLDVGTNNEQLLADPFYIGLRQPRVTGAEYDQFIDNFMQAVVKRYGSSTLIQFEDFANKNAFRLLKKYKGQYLTFNDDIQGTASVALAGLLAATRITGKRISENRLIFYGAGEANCGIAHLTCMSMMEEGLSYEEAKKRVFMIDSKGLLTKNRTGLNEHKSEWVQDYKDMQSLEEIVNEIKPYALVGCSTVAGSFTEKVIRDMAAINERPIIMALSNPTSKAECTAEQCYTFSDGRGVFASGSPFDAVTIGGKTLYPGQGNNSYIFPGVALGAVLVGARHVTDEMFLAASKTLAKLVSQEHLDEGRVYPPLQNIREYSIKIAAAVAEYCYKHGVASSYPEPVDKEEFVRMQVYNPKYPNYIPETYDWPAEHMKVR